MVRWNLFNYKKTTQHLMTFYSIAIVLVHHEVILNLEVAASPLKD